jgi:DNA-binding transcriptional regulator YdaS (Cro superfamily)
VWDQSGSPLLRYFTVEHVGLQITPSFSNRRSTRRQLSPERQDYIARAILALSAEEVDPEDLRYVLQGLAETERREFTPDTEAVLRRFLAG